MLFDEVQDERAVRQDRCPALAGGIECAPDQRRAQTLTLEPAVDLGVNEPEHLAALLIGGPACELVADPEFESVLGHVLPDFGLHSHAPIVSAWVEQKVRRGTRIMARVSFVCL
jgi:hypothetical protein